MHSTAVDGPYVFYANGQVDVRYIRDEHGKMIIIKDSISEADKEKLQLTISTDIPGETFKINFKPRIQKERSESKKISKQFVISDIEGNFGAFRKLLVAGGVMDNQFNWTFGEGHLVLTGDFFDRGSQVTEVLWLIYSLEEKAKAAGGYVHFVLGNHEIMNLSGDIRYVHKKYIDVAAALNQPYVNLFSENTELGRWLRSKNIMERVGDMLYVHGGVSADMNLLDMSLANINEMAQPFYADSSYQYPDPRVAVIYNDNGPFWYRGYYSGTPLATKSQVDSTIQKYNVRHVVTGHTLIGDTISVWFNGKVINTDVHHAQGKSEALFIDGTNYYRVTAAGVKSLMMTKKR